MAVNCVVVDAGARYGLHPTWSDLQGLVDFHLFEMDADEARRLDRKYAADPRIQVYPVALYSEDTTLVYRVHEHHALNSVYQSNTNLLSQNDYMLREFAALDERRTDARALDSLFAARDVHFLKLDVEGAELELLKGADRLLRRTVLGVRSEVLFAPIFEGAAQFGELHAFMLARGFELLNLDYTGAGNKAGRFSLPNRYGKLLSTDAVWVVGNDRLFADRGDALMHNVLRFSIFLMNNGGTDLAVDTLLRAVGREGVRFDAVGEDPLFQALNRKVLMLFKSLLSFPMLPADDITETYRAIFGREFPTMNRFFESL